MLGQKNLKKINIKKSIESGQAPTQRLRTRSVSEHFSKTPAPTEEQINNVFYSNYFTFYIFFRDVPC